MMKDEAFWQIVDEIGWPEVHYDEAKYRFILAHPPAVAEEYERSIARPHLMFEREERGEHKESFAYCIPSPSDYALLTDEGYEHFLRSIRRLLEEMDATDPDDVPPREYRQYPEVRRLAELFLARKWAEGVRRYHELYGPGYADSLPTSFAGYGIPNLVRNLERFRLRGGTPAR